MFCPLWSSVISGKEGSRAIRIVNISVRVGVIIGGNFSRAIVHCWPVLTEKSVHLEIDKEYSLKFVEEDICIYCYR